MAGAIVGREEELGVLEALLDGRAAMDGPTAVALEGEAGIGNSTLWREAVEAARLRGLRVCPRSGRPHGSHTATAAACDLDD